MNEFTTLYQATGAGIALVISSFLYSLGGRAGGPGKWVRRFLGSFILAATVCGLCVLRGTFNWWLMGVWPLLIGGMSLGYGAESLGGKIARRSIFCGGVVSAGALCAYFLHGWLVFIPHVGVAVWSIYLGVRNPVEASFEEWYISMLLNLGLIAYPFVS